MGAGASVVEPTATGTKQMHPIHTWQSHVTVVVHRSRYMKWGSACMHGDVCARALTRGMAASYSFIDATRRGLPRIEGGRPGSLATHRSRAASQVSMNEQRSPSTLSSLPWPAGSGAAAGVYLHLLLRRRACMPPINGPSKRGGKNKKILNQAACQQVPDDRFTERPVPMEFFETFIALNSMPGY